MSARKNSLLWPALAAIGLLVFLLAAAAAWLVARHLPAATPVKDASQRVRLAWPSAQAPDADVWKVFVPAPGAVKTATAKGPLAERYRLAGTFFLSGSDGATNVLRKAILDDVRAGRQLLIAEGERAGELEAVAVAGDHAVLREGGLEETIWLTFLKQQEAASSNAVANSDGAGEPAAEVALETTRFGKRVGLNRWVIERDALVKYYQEILEDPERVAALYVSLKPDYQEKDIKGYNLDVAGEADFFKSVGLSQGDTIRKVNSMNMTSQKRAEYFIGEFMKNRVNAFVLDIEREGKPEKLIYLIR